MTEIPPSTLSRVLTISSTHPTLNILYNKKITLQNRSKGKKQKQNKDKPLKNKGIFAIDIIVV